MTPTPPRKTPAAGAPATAGRPSPLHRAAFVIALVACVPYLTLKVLWVSGSELGIPAESVLLDPDRAGLMRAVNALTILMDSAVIGLALLLTRPWGRRVPAWLLALPAWCACGFLAPIAVGFPLQAAVTLVAGDGAGASREAETFLEPWVFTVVYTGFLVQGLALTVLFVRYARARWAPLWQGRLAAAADSPTLPALRATAVAAAALALVPLTMQLVWATGSTAGLSHQVAEGHDRGAAVVQAGNALLTATAVAGILLLAFRPAGRLRLSVPLAMGWVGSGALVCWGGWLLVNGLGAGDGDAGPAGTQPTPAMSLVYAAQMVAGMLIASAGTHFLAERDAATRTAGAPETPGGSEGPGTSPGAEAPDASGAPSPTGVLGR